MGARLIAAGTVVAALALAPSALGDTASSTNWAGYAVHRSGVSFAAVQGAWRQPAVSCRAGSRTFSSYWIGLGGFSDNSNAIEQIGTEADCTRSGAMSITAWYELLPQPSMPIRLTVHAGDTMAALVLIKGHRVAFSLYDLTRGKGFTRTVRAGQVDTSSAEWIVEAPSVCVSAATCLTLPLADFGSTSFSSAAARTVRGHAGAITDPTWQVTKIALQAGAGRLVKASSAASGSGGAVVGALGPTGQGFTVRYAPLPESSPGGTSPLTSSLRAGQRAHLALLQ